MKQYGAEPARLEYLVWPAYILAALLVIVSGTDALIRSLPLNPGAARWRFGAVGIFTMALVQPAAGLMLALAVAHAFGRKWGQRVSSALATLVGIVLLLAPLLFLLDSLQLRREVRPNVKALYDISVLRAVVVQLLMGIMLLWAGIASFRVRRRALRARAPKPEESVPLVRATHNDSPLARAGAVARLALRRAPPGSSPRTDCPWPVFEVCCQTSASRGERERTGCRA